MSHQDRREQLPKGYQFGDAGKPMPLPLGEYERLFESAKARIGDSITVRVPRLLTAADARWPTQPLGVRIENA